MPQISRGLAFSLLPGALSHGFVVHPRAIQPGATDYDLASYHLRNDSDNYHNFNWDLTFWVTDNNANGGYRGPAPFDAPGEGNIVASCGVHHVVSGFFNDTTCGFDGHEKGAWDKEAPGYKQYPYSDGDRCDARVYLSKFGGSPPVTQWQAGSTQEVAYAIHAAHCGGVAWRLCAMEKVDKDVGNAGATEQCFQDGHLRFATAETCVRCPDDPTGARDRCFPASDKTDSRGNVWRKNFLEPGPSSENYCDNPEHNFPHVAEYAPGMPHAQFSLVDMVEVPSDLAPGRYALSWRWDCGQTDICDKIPTHQIWTNCAEVEVVAGASPAALV